MPCLAAIYFQINSSTLELCLSSRGLGDGQGFLVMSLVTLARQVLPILRVVAWHTWLVPFGRAREDV